jgi:hypothetical protein
MTAEEAVLILTEENIKLRADKARLEAELAKLKGDEVPILPVVLGREKPLGLLREWAAKATDYKVVIVIGLPLEGVGVQTSWSDYSNCFELLGAIEAGKMAIAASAGFLNIKIEPRP